MKNDELNHRAYNDVLDCKEPSMPDNKEYMRYYRFWRPLQPKALFDDDF